MYISSYDLYDGEGMGVKPIMYMGGGEVTGHPRNLTGRWRGQGSRPLSTWVDPTDSDSAVSLVRVTSRRSYTIYWRLQIHYWLLNDILEKKWATKKMGVGASCCGKKIGNFMLWKRGVFCAVENRMPCTVEQRKLYVLEKVRKFCALGKIENLVL